MIVLLTDFGNSQYPGILKGVIARIAPDVRVVDLSHHVTAHTIVEGAFVLATSFRSFPDESIFVAVVDPGTGTDRPALALRTARHWFVGPGNGLLDPAVVADGGVRGAYRLDPRAATSRTFHGRDVFAPAAARLARGQSPDSFGSPIEHTPSYRIPLEGRNGTVCQIDPFGNVITNLPPSNQARYQVRLRNERFEVPFFETYGRAPARSLFLVTSSAGTLEIALRCDRAANELSVSPGDRLEIV